MVFKTSFINATILMLVTLPLKTYNSNICYHAYVSPNVVKFFQNFKKNYLKKNENICDKVFFTFDFHILEKICTKKTLGHAMSFFGFLLKNIVTIKE
jgi:hypothetical protein